MVMAWIRPTPSGFSRSAADPEEGRQVAVADRLDHLDGDQPVELPAQVAVILLQQGDLPVQPGLPDPLCGQVVLLPGDGGGGDVAAVVSGGMDGEAAPAGADLQQAHAGREAQFPADAVELGDGGLFHGAVGALEDAAGIGHGRIEEQLVEIVAQVVVGGDVPAAAAAGVVVQTVQQALERNGRPRQPSLQAVPGLPGCAP